MKSYVMIPTTAGDFEIFSFVLDWFNSYFHSFSKHCLSYRYIYPKCRVPIFIQTFQHSLSLTQAKVVCINLIFHANSTHEKETKSNTHGFHAKTSCDVICPMSTAAAHDDTHTITVSCDIMYLDMIKIIIIN